MRLPVDVPNDRWAFIYSRYGLVGTTVPGTTVYLQCNQMGPLDGNNTEAFMLKISDDTRTVTFYWHDGSILSEPFGNDTEVDTICDRFYPGVYCSAINEHETQRRFVSGNGDKLITSQHSANTVSLNIRIGTNIKEFLQVFVNRGFLKLTKVLSEKLDLMIKEMDVLYDNNISTDSLRVSTYDTHAFMAFGKASVELKTMRSTLTSANKDWTLFELKHLLRITINDYFYRILEHKPLQSHLSFHTNSTATLRRLESALDQSL